MIFALYCLCPVFLRRLLVWKAPCCCSWQPSPWRDNLYSLLPLSWEVLRAAEQYGVFLLLSGSEQQGGVGRENRESAFRRSSMGPGIGEVGRRYAFGLGEGFQFGGDFRIAVGQIGSFADVLFDVIGFGWLVPSADGLPSPRRTAQECPGNSQKRARSRK